MNIRHYQEFKEYEEKGLKREASKSLHAFIASFENEKEIKAWVYGSTYLSWRQIDTQEFDMSYSMNLYIQY